MSRATPADEDPDRREAQEATERLKAARADRDRELREARQRANDAFWCTVAEIADSGVLLKKDVAAAIGYDPESLRTNTARARARRAEEERREGRRRGR